MKALTWHGKRDVRVDEVPDPTIEAPTDAIIRVTSSGLCGSDLHLYELFGPFMDEGDILGHEPMGIVEAVGSQVINLNPGDRVVIPFNISCGHCWMCDRGLSCPMSCQRPGKGLSMHRSRRADPSQCSVSGRSARWRRALRNIGVLTKSLESTSSRSGWRWPPGTVLRPSTSTTLTTSAMSCGRGPAGADRIQ